MVLFMFLVMLGIGIFWVFEFVEFMRMKADAFPNEHDRYIWAAAFILVFPATPFAFFLWQMMYEPEKDEKAGMAAKAGLGGDDVTGGVAE